jgi:hypothetical protein
MIRIPAILILAVLGFSSCSDFGSGFVSDSQEVELRCLDIVSNCGSLQVVVNSQAEYDQLIFQRFTRPLQEHWDRHYASILASVRGRYPGLTDEQYEDSVRAIFYQVAPFRGTEGCVHPSFDFERYTLLGVAAHGAGCSQPEYATEIYRDDDARALTVIVKIVQHGYCEVSICHNIWVLIPKVPSSYDFRVRRIVSQD